MPKTKPTAVKLSDILEKTVKTNAEWVSKGLIPKTSPTKPTAVRVSRLEPPTDASHAVGVTKLNPLPTTASKTEIREKAEGYRIAHHQFLQETRELLSRLEAGVRGMMVGTWKSWIAKTKPHGGTREEWERLNNHGYDEAIKDVLALIEKEKG